MPMQPSPSAGTVRAPRGRCSSIVEGPTRSRRPVTMALMETGVAFAALDPDHEDRFLPLRRMLGGTSFGLNQIILRPGQRGRIPRHPAQEEVYLVLSGTLTLGIEGEERELGQGELVRVAPDVRRQLV